MDKEILMRNRGASLLAGKTSQPLQLSSAVSHTHPNLSAKNEGVLIYLLQPPVQKSAEIMIKKVASEIACKNERGKYSLKYIEIFLP